MSDSDRACADAAAARREARESSKGALLITPIPPHKLEDINCPICQEPYSEVPSSTKVLENDSEQEWAVSIDMVAEWFGPKKCCGHIMGRRCLEKHLQAAGQWRNKCPLCRDIWFHESVPAHVQRPVAPPAPAPARPQPSSTVAPRRSARLAAREATRLGTVQPRMSESNGIIRAPHHERRRPRPERFTSQLMAALEVEDGSCEVKGTFEEVTQRLSRLYGGLE